MTKTTKAIAALSIVAGLGVAAMPLSTYAATVSGDVKVEVEVQDSIAMRIHSNNDATADAWEAVADPTGDPSAQGYYEQVSAGVYILSSDTTVDAGKTYYQPTAKYYGYFGVNPDGTHTAGDIIAAGPSMATGLQLSGNAYDANTLFSNISVRSNTGAYSLVMQDADTTTALTDTTSDPANSDTIPSVVGTNQDLVRTTAGWGFHVGEVNNKWDQIPSSADTAATIVASGSNTPGSFSSDTTVHYGIATGAAHTGTYSDTITYTATSI